MMDASRHKSMDTLRGYVRDADLFRDHAGAGLLYVRLSRTLSFRRVGRKAGEQLIRHETT
jgi:hypothetical protein